MALLADMKADLPESALGTPRWSRLSRLEDLLMRVVAHADVVLSDQRSAQESS
ncbi:MAG: hypothetical protein VXX57_01430 [Cyanobacteriota bacterium]|nr:hypothetical protein [Cyanobacteriota bacterium]